MITRHIQITTHSPEETQVLGQKIGELLKAGIVLTLTGDLGSGKTCFVQGLAIGLGVPSDYYITSPTYTLINEYPGRYPLFHVDLYRIEDLLDLDDIGLYEILHGDGVVAIEWAERLGKDLPSEHVNIDFEILDHESRKIGITAYGFEGVNMIKMLENIFEEKK